MSMNKKSIIAICAAAAAVIASITAIVVLKSQPKGMTVAVSTLPDSLNPILEQNTSGLNANELIFDGLTNAEVNEATGKYRIEFALAENIEQDQKDRKTYKVTLRDVTWHDGEPLTSADVVYSFKAYTDKANNSPKREYIESFIEDIVAVDEKTVNVIFKKPIPEYNAYAVLTFKIIPSKYNGQEMSTNMREGDNEKSFATAPIGTGPFKFSNWEILKWITFDANGLYFKSVPQAETLVIKRTIDPIIRMNELKKGRINLILETNPMDRPAVAKISNVDINSYLPYAFYEVELNTKLFPNAEGRQAMAMALDKKNLIPSITDQESGVVINNGPYPSNLYTTTIPNYFNKEVPNLLPYNLEKAKELAASSGIKGQNAILIYPDSMGEFGKQMAEGIAKQLSEIGLNVEPKKTGDQVFKRMVFKEKSYEMALMYRDGFDNQYSTLGDSYRTNGSENVTGIADKKLNALFDELGKENETKTWLGLTQSVNERVSELSPALYLCTLQKDVYSRGLKNVVIATDNPFLSVENWKFKE